MASGLVLPTWKDAVGAAGLTVDLSADTLKLALFDSTLSVDFLTTTNGYASAPFNSGEVTGADYTAGGPTLTTPAWGVTSLLRFDADDVTISGEVTAGAETIRNLVLWDDTATGDRVLFVADLGSSYAAPSGFDIVWDSGGIFGILA